MYMIWSASKTTLNSNWVLPLSKVIFREIETTTFHQSEKYLRQHYGSNFMVLPNDDERRVGINRIEIFIRFSFSSISITIAFCFASSASCSFLLWCSSNSMNSARNQHTKPIKRSIFAFFCLSIFIPLSF